MNKQEQKKLYIELDQLHHALANFLIIGLFYVSNSIFNRPESKTKECANFKFEVKSSVK